MADDTADLFKRTLQEAERTKDVEPLVQLFTDNAEVGNPMLPKIERGRDGARTFWKEYLAAFGQVRSKFTDTSGGESFAALEWESDGTLPDGGPVKYRGVSLLQFHGGKVSRFRTYYDSAAFLPDGSKHVDGH